MIRPWKTLSSTAHGDFRVFKIRKHRRVSPRTGEEHEFSVLDCVNWVNVVAVTLEQQVILIEQFRHGTETIELEVPGGVMDAHDPSPAATGVRELREETGFEGANAQIIGSVLPNPAIMSNTCYTVLIENCRQIHPVEFDSTEDVVTRLMPTAMIPELVAGGKIRHSLVVAALYFFELWQRSRKSVA